ncbi:MAG: formyl transferase [Syntrophomonadaceae bacterium]|nr:formyl transferase [Syntrophomonadaceae bacterium]
MRILLLGPARANIIQYLTKLNNEIICNEQPIINNLQCKRFDFVISYGYRHIIQKEVIDYYTNRIINLHISLLPWNRGADPNLWSYLEDTPKGVSIHRIDTGIDTGPILVQQECCSEPGHTLRTSYERLGQLIELAFFQNWPSIASGTIEAVKQDNGGSYHRSKDKDKYLYLLTKGWDTPVRNIIGKALE